MLGKTNYVWRKIIIEQLSIDEFYASEMNNALGHVIETLNLYGSTIENVVILKVDNKGKEQKYRVEVLTKCKAHKWADLEEDLHNQIIRDRKSVEGITTGMV